MNAVKFIPEKIEGKHVWLALLAFFGLMIVANGIFLYYAVGTFNGNETADAYRKGLDYNQRIALDTAQSARGWKPSAHYDANAGQLAVEVKNRQGGRVAGLNISAEIRRPVNDKQDQHVSLIETNTTRYAAPLKLAPGQWILSLEGFEPDSPDQPAFRFRRRLWVKESP